MVEADSQAAFLAVGRLNVRGQGFCTATLIGPRTVLTAAHCVVDRRTRAIVAPDRVHFLAGFRIGAYAAHGRAIEIRLDPRYDRVSDRSENDVAVIVLAAPVTGDIRPFALGDGTDGSMVLVSYGMDRSQIASIETGCRVVREVGEILLTDCSGLPGTSGAPLLRRVADDLVVVGVVSAVVRAGKSRIPRGDVVALRVNRARLERLRATGESG